MPATIFKHTPLARPAEQIRLLKLQPGTGLIRLKLQTYELTESPAYVALSYEWGDGSDMHDIIIDGAVFQIRQNLRDALEHIRILQANRSSTRLFDEDSPHFWIDAITIDQSSTGEKTHQVSIMGNIFRQASHVVAWLGLEQLGDDSALAMKHLSTGHKEPYSHMSRPGHLSTGHEEPYPDKFGRIRVAIASAEQVAIRKLWARSYFERIWIVQECILARKLHLVCGFQYCSWKHLYEYGLSMRLHYESRCELVFRLFAAKSDFESNWHNLSIQRTMSSIMKVACDRHCSQFHDRIYGLLGILQQSFRSTGMVVNYALSREELMIKTYEFLTSDPENDNLFHDDVGIGAVFGPEMPVEVLGKVAWYLQINEIMQKLDADVIKGFHKLETLGGEKERALIFQIICWIVGGYGIDLFSPSKGATSLSTATKMMTTSLESLKNDQSKRFNNRIFRMYSRYTTGILTFCISLTHCPKQPLCLLYHDTSRQYEMTESNSWGCRSLLETYSKRVQTLSRMRESFKVSTKVSDMQIQTQLPIQVQWTVFSNLLAQYFLSKYSYDEWPNHKTRTDGFVRQVEPEGKDLGTFLTESLFSKYRMSVAETSDELPVNFLTSVEIEITNSNEADGCSDIIKKTLVAALYDNDA